MAIAAEMRRLSEEEAGIASRMAELERERVELRASLGAAEARTISGIAS